MANNCGLHCRYYTDKVLRWCMSNKLIVFLSALSFCLFVSTLAMSAQRNRARSELTALQDSLKTTTTPAAFTTTDSDTTTTDVTTTVDPDADTTTSETTTTETTTTETTTTETTTTETTTTTEVPNKSAEGQETKETENINSSRILQLLGYPVAS